MILTLLYELLLTCMPDEHAKLSMQADIPASRMSVGVISICLKNVGDTATDNTA